MRRLVEVLRICLLLVSVLMAKFQGQVRAAGIKQKGKDKPQDCNATAFSSSAVLLTWNLPNNNENKSPNNVSIHYRALYSKGKFTILHAGDELHYLVENLDVVTYYTFRIVSNDSSGNQNYCEVLAKTLRDAKLSVALRMEINPGSRRGLLVKWKAVTLQDAQPIYRLFMEWRHKGKLHVRLLYEGNETFSVIKGKLPFPHRMYVSVVIEKQQFKHQAGNILTYPTKQALIPQTKYSTPSKPAAETRNRTLALKVSVDAYAWNFARISWNAVKMGKRQVTYTVTCKAGDDVIKVVTSKTSVLLSGLSHLTRYEIKVEALENNGTLLMLSAEIYLTTSGELFG